MPGRNSYLNQATNSRDRGEDYEDNANRHLVSSDSNN